jgi:hypothetical protein
MNREKACALLGVSAEEIHTPILKKKYRSKCLRYHPDKKGDKEKFIELKEAYDFLLKEPKEESILDSIHESLLRQYLYSIYKSEIEWFKHPLFVKYCVLPIQKHLQEYKTYCLKPTLTQMLRQDIFYLEEEKLYIPLWHQEIVFHGKIKVILEPILPENIELDENNNILVSGEPDSIVIDTLSILINEKERKEKRMIGKGIPRIQFELYDVSELSDILFV